jgi:hypothetical protein
METTIENAILYIVSMGAPTALLIVVAIHYFRTRNRERMAIIEKGGELPQTSLLDLINRKTVLKTGLFLIGISFGVLAGWIMNLTIPEAASDEEFAFFITVPFFTGISLIVSYMIR